MALFIDSPLIGVIASTYSTPLFSLSVKLKTFLNVSASFANQWLHTFHY